MERSRFLAQRLRVFRAEHLWTTAGCAKRNQAGRRPQIGLAHAQGGKTMTSTNGDNRLAGRRTGPKCIAIVGPFASGKTTLMEAILERTGAIARQAATGSGATVGDHGAEARAHGMGVEATIATTQFMGESITFIDCPGSVEFNDEANGALAACDAAIVVAEADAAHKLPALQSVLRKLDRMKVPRILFLNQIDKAKTGIREMLQLLQPLSDTPLLLRQIPLTENGIVVGAIDLALERAYIYREHAESEVAEIPDEEKAREIEARFSMLERLADHDDKLMEELLSDIEPPRDQIFDDLSAELRAGQVVPVLLGSADKGNGILRLLKTIRHDCPGVEDTCARLRLEDTTDAVCAVMKTIHTTHGGKLSVARVLAGTLKEGMELTASNGQTGRISGISSLFGKDLKQVQGAQAGDTVALGKVEPALTGMVLTSGRKPLPALESETRQPVFSIALRPKARKDDVRLSAALKKLLEEDPSLSIRQDAETGEVVLSGHGEMHLRVAVERLEGKYQIPVDRGAPTIPFRETIRKSATQRGRHKKQSGGHGQFGDVVLEIKPQRRGEGFAFSDTITGGVVPKQYIQSVETGVRDYLREGPLGFPVVDVAVNLSDGSYHNVDSSDMAFQMAAKLAMREGMAACDPVLLEPVMRVEIATPSDATAKITALIPQRRGRILGYDSLAGWAGWDRVEAMLPLAEMADLIVDLRSATAGAASYTTQFDHMAELTGRVAEEVMAKSKAAHAA
jgi:elongation factor G